MLKKLRQKSIIGTITSNCCHQRNLFKYGIFIIFFFLLTAPIFISPPPAQAKIDWSNLPGKDPVNEDLYDFCRRRQGNQMNLETWYSGKCKKNENTYSGEYVGFADIVILDIFERINPTGMDDGSESFSDKFTKWLTFHRSIFDPSSKIDPVTATNNIRGSGILGQTASILSLPLSTPPANLSSYIASVKQNLNNHKIIKDAVAANEGYGFNSFAPILPIWKAFRNIAYFVFVVFFIAMGFAIMFRVKINPHSVIGIQTILPKIIALLLLITFSYAIVGLMIDLMYVIFYLLINALTVNNVIRKGLGINIPGVGSIGFGQPVGVLVSSGQLGLAVSMIFHSLIAITMIPSAVAAAITGIPIGMTFIVDMLFTAVGLGLIIRIILVIAIIYTFFKLFVKLLGAYINIVIQLIFAPIILLGGVFPGSKTIGNWFRNLLANMSVFPTTMILLLLSYIFMAQPIFNLNPLMGLINTTGVNDLIKGYGTGILNAPLIFAGKPGAANIMALIGIGLLLMASKYVDIIKEALQVPPFKYGSAIGEALMWGPQMVQKGQRTYVGQELQYRGYHELSKKVGGVKTQLGGFLEGLSKRYKPK